MNSADKLRAALAKSMSINGDAKRKREHVMPEDQVVPPLTDAEILAFRAEQAQSARVRWLWASVRAWVVWLAGAAAVIVWFKDHLKAFLRWALGI